VCLCIQRDKKSAGTLLPTCRLEDENFVRRYVHSEVVKIYLKKKILY
jgi:hypothetical protein